MTIIWPEMQCRLWKWSLGRRAANFQTDSTNRREWFQFPALIQRSRRFSALLCSYVEVHCTTVQSSFIFCTALSLPPGGTGFHATPMIALFVGPSDSLSLCFKCYSILNGLIHLICERFRIDDLCRRWRKRWTKRWSKRWSKSWTKRWTKRWSKMWSHTHGLSAKVTKPEVEAASAFWIHSSWGVSLSNASRIEWGHCIT